MASLNERYGIIFDAAVEVSNVTLKESNEIYKSLENALSDSPQARALYEQAKEVGTKAANAVREGMVDAGIFDARELAKNLRLELDNRVLQDLDKELDKLQKDNRRRSIPIDAELTERARVAFEAIQSLNLSQPRKLQLEVEGIDKLQQATQALEALMTLQFDPKRISFSGLTEAARKAGEEAAAAAATRFRIRFRDLLKSMKFDINVDAHVGKINIPSGQQTPVVPVQGVVQTATTPAPAATRPTPAPATTSVDSAEQAYLEMLATERTGAGGWSAADTRARREFFTAQKRAREEQARQARIAQVRSDPTPVVAPPPEHTRSVTFRTPHSLTERSVVTGTIMRNIGRVKSVAGLRQRLAESRVPLHPRRFRDLALAEGVYTPEELELAAQEALDIQQVLNTHDYGSEAYEAASKQAQRFQAVHKRRLQSYIEERFPHFAPMAKTLVRRIDPLTDFSSKLFHQWDESGTYRGVQLPAFASAADPATRLQDTIRRMMSGTFGHGEAALMTGTFGTPQTVYDRMLKERLEPLIKQRLERDPVYRDRAYLHTRGRALAPDETGTRLQRVYDKSPAEVTELVAQLYDPKLDPNRRQEFLSAVLVQRAGGKPFTLGDLIETQSDIDKMVRPVLRDIYQESAGQLDFTVTAEYNKLRREAARRRQELEKLPVDFEFGDDDLHSTRGRRRDVYKRDETREAGGPFRTEKIRYIDFNPREVFDIGIAGQNLIRRTEGQFDKFAEELLRQKFAERGVELNRVGDQWIANVYERDADGRRRLIESGHQDIGLDLDDDRSAFKQINHLDREVLDIVRRIQQEPGTLLGEYQQYIRDIEQELNQLRDAFGSTPEDAVTTRTDKRTGQPIRLRDEIQDKINRTTKRLDYLRENYRQLQTDLELGSIDDRTRAMLLSDVRLSTGITAADYLTSRRIEPGVISKHTPERYALESFRRGGAQRFRAQVPAAETAQEVREQRRLADRILNAGKVDTELETAAQRRLQELDKTKQDALSQVRQEATRRSEPVRADGTTPVDTTISDRLNEAQVRNLQEFADKLETAAQEVHNFNRKIVEGAQAADQARPAEPDTPPPPPPQEPPPPPTTPPAGGAGGGDGGWGPYSSRYFGPEDDYLHRVRRLNREQSLAMFRTYAQEQGLDPRLVIRSVEQSFGQNFFQNYRPESILQYLNEATVSEAFRTGDVQRAVTGLRDARRGEDRRLRFLEFVDRRAQGQSYTFDSTNQIRDATMRREHERMFRMAGAQGVEAIRAGGPDAVRQMDMYADRARHVTERIRLLQNSVSNSLAFLISQSAFVAFGAITRQVREYERNAQTIAALANLNRRGTDPRHMSQEAAVAGRALAVNDSEIVRLMQAVRNPEQALQAVQQMRGILQATGENMGDLVGFVAAAQSLNYRRPEELARFVVRRGATLQDATEAMQTLEPALRIRDARTQRAAITGLALTEGFTLADAESIRIAQVDRLARVGESADAFAQATLGISSFDQMGRQLQDTLTQVWEALKPTVQLLGMLAQGFMLATEGALRFMNAFGPLGHVITTMTTLLGLFIALSGIWKSLETMEFFKALIVGSGEGLERVVNAFRSLFKLDPIQINVGDLGSKIAQAFRSASAAIAEVFAQAWASAMAKRAAGEGLGAAIGSFFGALAANMRALFTRLVPMLTGALANPWTLGIVAALGGAYLGTRALRQRRDNRRAQEIYDELFDEVSPDSVDDFIRTMAAALGGDLSPELERAGYTVDELEAKVERMARSSRREMRELAETIREAASEYKVLSEIPEQYRSIYERRFRENFFDMVHTDRVLYSGTRQQVELFRRFAESAGTDTQSPFRSRWEAEFDVINKWFRSIPSQVDTFFRGTFYGWLPWADNVEQRRADSPAIQRYREALRTRDFAREHQRVASDERGQLSPFLDPGRTGSWLDNLPFWRRVDTTVGIGLSAQPELAAFLAHQQAMRQTSAELIEQYAEYGLRNFSARSLDRLRERNPEAYANVMETHSELIEQGRQRRDAYFARVEYETRMRAVMGDRLYDDPSFVAELMSDPRALVRAGEGALVTEEYRTLIAQKEAIDRQIAALVLDASNYLNFDFGPTGEILSFRLKENVREVEKASDRLRETQDRLGELALQSGRLAAQMRDLNIQHVFNRAFMDAFTAEAVDVNRVLIGRQQLPGSYRGLSDYYQSVRDVYMNQREPLTNEQRLELNRINAWLTSEWTVVHDLAVTAAQNRRNELEDRTDLNDAERAELYRRHLREIVTDPETRRVLTLIPGLHGARPEELVNYLADLTGGRDIFDLNAAYQRHSERELNRRQLQVEEEFLREQMQNLPDLTIDRYGAHQADFEFRRAAAQAEQARREARNRLLNDPAYTVDVNGVRVLLMDRPETQAALQLIDREYDLAVEQAQANFRSAMSRVSYESFERNLNRNLNLMVGLDRLGTEISMREAALGSSAFTDQERVKNLARLEQARLEQERLLIERPRALEELRRREASIFDTFTGLGQLDLVSAIENLGYQIQQEARITGSDRFNEFGVLAPGSGQLFDPNSPLGRLLDAARMGQELANTTLSSLANNEALVSLARWEGRGIAGLIEGGPDFIRSQIETLINAFADTDAFIERYGDEARSFAARYVLEELGMQARLDDYISRNFQLRSTRLGIRGDELNLTQLLSGQLGSVANQQQVIRLQEQLEEYRKILGDEGVAEFEVLSERFRALAPTLDQVQTLLLQADFESKFLDGFEALERQGQAIQEAMRLIREEVEDTEQANELINAQLGEQLAQHERAVRQLERQGEQMARNVRFQREFTYLLQQQANIPQSLRTMNLAAVAHSDGERARRELQIEQQRQEQLRNLETELQDRAGDRGGLQQILRDYGYSQEFVSSLDTQALLDTVSAVRREDINTQAAAELQNVLRETQGNAIQQAINLTQSGLGRFESWSDRLEAVNQWLQRASPEDIERTESYFQQFEALRELGMDDLLDTYREQYAQGYVEPDIMRQLAQFQRMLPEEAQDLLGNLIRQGVDQSRRRVSTLQALAPAESSRARLRLLEEMLSFDEDVLGLELDSAVAAAQAGDQDAREYLDRIRERDQLQQELAIQGRLSDPLRRAQRRIERSDSEERSLYARLGVRQEVAGELQGLLEAYLRELDITLSPDDLLDLDEAEFEAMFGQAAGQVRSLAEQVVNLGREVRTLDLEREILERFIQPLRNLEEDIREADRSGNIQIQISTRQRALETIQRDFEELTSSQIDIQQALRMNVEELSSAYNGQGDLIQELASKAREASREITILTRTLENELADSVRNRMRRELNARLGTSAGAEDLNLEYGRFADTIQDQIRALLGRGGQVYTGPIEHIMELARTGQRSRLSNFFRADGMDPETDVPKLIELVQELDQLNQERVTFLVQRRAMDIGREQGRVLAGGELTPGGIIEILEGGRDFLRQAILETARLDKNLEPLGRFSTFDELRPLIEENEAYARVLDMLDNQADWIAAGLGALQELSERQMREYGAHIAQGDTSGAREANRLLEQAILEYVNRYLESIDQQPFDPGGDWEEQILRLGLLGDSGVNAMLSLLALPYRNQQALDARESQQALSSLRARFRAYQPLYRSEASMLGAEERELQAINQQLRQTYGVNEQDQLINASREMIDIYERNLTRLTEITEEKSLLLTKQWNDMLAGLVSSMNIAISDSLKALFRELVFGDIDRRRAEIDREYEAELKFEEDRLESLINRRDEIRAKLAAGDGDRDELRDQLRMYNEEIRRVEDAVKRLNHEWERQIESLQTIGEIISEIFRNLAQTMLDQILDRYITWGLDTIFGAIGGPMMGQYGSTTGQGSSSTPEPDTGTRMGGQAVSGAARQLTDKAVQESKMNELEAGALMSAFTAFGVAGPGGNPLAAFGMGLGSVMIANPAAIVDPLTLSLTAIGAGIGMVVDNTRRMAEARRREYVGETQGVSRYGLERFGPSARFGTNTPLIEIEEVNVHTVGLGDYHVSREAARKIEAETRKQANSRGLYNR